MKFRQGCFIAVMMLAFNVSGWSVLAQDAPDDIDSQPGTRLSYALSGLAPNRPVTVTLRASDLLAQDLNTTTTADGTVSFDNVDISNLDNKQTTLTAQIPVIFSFEWDDRNDNFTAEESELTPLITTVTVSMNLKRFSSDMTVNGTDVDDLSDLSVQFGLYTPGTKQVAASGGLNLSRSRNKSSFGSLPFFHESILDGNNDAFMQLSFTDGGLQRNQSPRQLAPINSLDVLGGVNSFDDAQAMPPVLIEMATTSVDDIPNGKGNSGLGNFLFGTVLAGGLGVVTSSLQDMASENIVRSQGRTQAIGTFFDVDQNLAAQETTNLLAAESAFDNLPSDQMCEIGSATQGLAEAEVVANRVKSQSAKVSGERDGNTEDSPSVSPLNDYQVRFANYLERYCRPDHNNNGMQLLCPDNDPNDPRRDRDIDIGFLLSDDQMTFDINYDDGVNTDDEEDVRALKNNLYGHNLMAAIPDSILENQFEGRAVTLDKRSIRATRNAVRMPFEIVEGQRAKTKESAGRPFLYAMLAKYNVADSDLERIRKKYGDNPSMHAQYTALVRDAMVNENDIVKLIDSKRNVSSMAAYKSALRMAMNYEGLEQDQMKELLLSLWLERLVRRQENLINAQLASEIRN